MNGVLPVSHISALKGYTGPWPTWANEMKFGMKHDPSALLFTQN